MKIRNGFVSNSSSSSFVIAVRQEAFKKEYDKLTDLEKQIVDVVYQPFEIFGQACMLYNSYHDMDGNGYPDNDTWWELELGDTEPTEVVYQFNEKIEKLGKNNIFKHSSGNG